MGSAGSTASSESGGGRTGFTSIARRLMTMSAALAAPVRHDMRRIVIVAIGRAARRADSARGLGARALNGSSRSLRSSRSRATAATPASMMRGFAQLEPLGDLSGSSRSKLRNLKTCGRWLRSGETRRRFERALLNLASAMLPASCSASALENWLLPSQPEEVLRTASRATLNSRAGRRAARPRSADIRPQTRAKGSMQRPSQLGHGGPPNGSSTTATAVASTYLSGALQQQQRRPKPAGASHHHHGSGPVGLPASHVDLGH